MAKRVADRKRASPAAAPLPCGAAGMRLESRAFKGARPSKIGGEMSSEGIVADPNMPVLAGADLDGLYLAGGARTLSLPHDANAGRRVRLRDSGRSEASAQDGGD